MVLRRRHFIKALTYRVVGSTMTAFIVWLYFRDWSLFLYLFSADAVCKILFYYVHERIWYKFKWGIKEK